MRKVYFYALEPEDDSKPCTFSADGTLAIIDQLDREAGKAYLETGLYDRLLGLVHSDGTTSMLSLWNIDTVNAPHFERKGTIVSYEMMDDEGVAEPAYAMFFEDRYMALLRPVHRSAGPKAIAEYLNHFTGCNLSFAALVQPDVLKLLKRPAHDIINARVRVKLRNLAPIGEARPDVEAAVRAAAKPAGATELTLTWKAALDKEKPHWWSETQPMLRDLVTSGAIDSFESAVVHVTGSHPVDLMSQHLTQSVPVDLLKGEKHVKPEAAAEALLRAYELRKDDLSTSATLP